MQCNILPINKTHVSAKPVSHSLCDANNNIFTSCGLVTTSIDNSYMTWHKRLGHPYSASLHKILTSLSKQTAHNLNFTPNSSLAFCDACQLGKLHHTSFPSSLSQASAPLELVHSDV